MYKVHGIFENKYLFKRRLQHLPVRGDMIRMDGVVFYEVVNIVWCLDECEHSQDDIRVNIELKLDE